MSVPELSPKQRRSIVRISGGAVLVLFVLILILDFMDQNMMSPLLNPLLLDFFGDITKTVPMGWIQSTYVIVSAISMIIAGILADRTTRKWICFVGCMIYSSVSIFSIFIPSGQAGYWLYFLTRTLNGIGIGAVIPTLFSLVGDIAKPERRATVFSYLNAAMIFGQMAGLLIAGIVEAETGNWRMPYFLVGIVNFILAFALIFVHEPKRGSKEKELQQLFVEGAEYRFRLERKDLKLIWTNKSNFWLIINFVDCIPEGIIFFLIFKFMEDVHYMQDDIMSIILLGAMVAGLVGTLLIGRLGDIWYRRDRRAKVVLAILCNGVPTVFFAIFLLQNYTLPVGIDIGGAFGNSQFLLTFILMSVVMFINQGVNPNWYSTLTDINLPEHRATMISMASFMDMFGRSIAPNIGTYIADAWGLHEAMWAAVIFWILNVGLWFPVFTYLYGDLDRNHQILEARAQAMENRPQQ